MPSVTGSPFNDEPVLRSASVKSSFSAPSVEPPPVANRFDVPSIKDFSLSFSLSLALLSTFPAFICAFSVSLYPIQISFLLARLVSRFPCVEKKSVPRFFVPFLSPIPDGFPPSIPPDFGESVFSVRDRFSRNSP